MKFSQVMSSAGEWLRGEGPHHQIVVSSRVRLARNLRQRPFPGWAKKAERTQILEQIKPRVEELSEMQDSFSERSRIFPRSKSRCSWNAISSVASTRPKASAARSS